MRYFCILFLILTSNQLHAQLNSKKLNGAWVCIKKTYNDGKVLPDEHPMKYVYIKYQFFQPDQLNITTLYSEKGNVGKFELIGDDLLIKSPQGGLMNIYHLQLLGDTLLFGQKQQQIDDKSDLKFYFIRESDYQQSLPVLSEHIFSVRGTDTIYRQNPKIYATYNGESFQRRIYDGISERISMDHRAGHLFATFVISKNGVADSVKILEGIDDEFNKRFVKVFNQTRKNWKAATLRGKPVSVQMSVDLRYSTSETAIPSYFSSQKANNAYNNKDYELAIYFYDQALRSTPTDKENLTKRGLCKLMLGNVQDARKDWIKVKEMGSTPAVDALLNKYN